MIVSRTGKYRVRPHKFRYNLILSDELQTIILTGFVIWSIGCGLISTITPHSSNAKLVIFMLITGCGAGQV